MGMGGEGTPAPDDGPANSVVEVKPTPPTAIEQFSKRQIEFAQAFLRSGNMMRAYWSITKLKMPLKEIEPEEERNRIYRVHYKRAEALLYSRGMHAFIKAEKERAYEAERLTTAEIIARLGRLARRDPRAYYDEEGNYVPFVQLDEAAAFAIHSWEDKLEFDKDGAPPTMIRKVKLIDPVPALRTLAQVESLLDKQSANVNLFLNLHVRMDRARKRRQAQLVADGIIEGTAVEREDEPQ